MWFWPFRRKRQASFSWERTPVRPTVIHDTQGRRHRTDAPYLLPKDMQEIQRLDYQHYLFRHLLQKNTFAPVETLLKHGGNVLDVGCGTGRWCYELATQYKQAQVIGFDLEEVPSTVSMPRNYRFQRGNLLYGLPFVGQQFHYVHQRLLVAAIPLDKWGFVIKELRRVTKGGGWVELVEMGATFHHPGPATQHFLAWFTAISNIRGIDASKVAHLPQFLHESGFSDIKAKTEVLPVGEWGGRIGNLLAQDILAGWPSMKAHAETLLGVSATDFDTVIGQLEAEWNRYHTCYEVYFACGHVERWEREGHSL